ncbi:hypothetical protein Q4Q39_14210 [Flavivirga amylovorans]|uniref:Uncharacterized protein n=1 Tax=Flavivirga amylovorans TaxID=870486 RepID=A0ABT8X3L7_9FLAO|nr:hypothetical protein [Flavivirga amylovorans]MDO5988561.1 hypothetical protein [Flavivirga amylovorans]
MMLILLVYNPTLEEWLVLGGGVFFILLIAYLFTKYTKYGGGSNYGITGEFDDDFDHLNDD